MKTHSVFSHSSVEGSRNYRLLLLAGLSLIVILATTALFLPVFAQPQGSTADTVICDTGAGPYPYPGPVSFQSGYAYPADPGQCAFLPVIMGLGR